MRRLAVLLLVLGILGLPSKSFGGYLSGFHLNGSTRNDVQFKDWENVYRFNSGTYELVSASTGLAVNDVVVQILRATVLNSNGGAFSTFELTGYAAFKVKSVGSEAVYFTYLSDTSGSLQMRSDPFNKGMDTSEQVMKLWFDSSKDLTDSALQSAAGPSVAVEAATNGDMFAAFGFDDAINGGGVTANANWKALTDSGRMYYYSGALNVLKLGALFSDVTFPGVVGANGVTSMLVTGTLSDTGVAYGPNWTWYSSDPMAFTLTPEPGGLAALASMTGLGCFIRLSRRRRD